MSTDKINQQQEPAPTCMVSVNRIAELPVVKSTIQTATTVYEKVKDYNSATHWTCTTAETVVNKAVEVGKPIATPIVQSLEGPIKKVDDILCSGLDYVETKVPAVKLPPTEMYDTTKGYVHDTIAPKVENICAYIQPTVNGAYEKLETAKGMVEPAIEKGRTMIEPMIGTIAKDIVEPVINKILVKEDDDVVTEEKPSAEKSNISSEKLDGKRKKQ